MDAQQLSQTEWNKSDLKKFLESVNAKWRVDEQGEEALIEKKCEKKLFDEDRVEEELQRFEPAHNEFSNNPFQYFVLKYGIFRCLFGEDDYRTSMSDLQGKVRDWEKSFDNEEEVEERSKKHPIRVLAKSATDYEKELSKDELNLIRKYIEYHNKNCEFKSYEYHWEDLFQELSNMGKFPKVPPQAKGEHSREDIKHAIYGLRNQGLVYIVKPEDSKIVGVPDETRRTVRHWMNISLEEERFKSLLSELSEDLLGIDRFREVQKEIFGETTGKGFNKKIDSIIEQGIHPEDFFKLALDKEKAKEIIREYNMKEVMDIHLGAKKEDLISSILRFFEEDQQDEGKEKWELYLDSYYAISTFNVDQVSRPLLKDLEGNKQKVLEEGFETATGAIFRNVFGYDEVQDQGQKLGGATKADGKIELDNGVILWDNKGKKNGKQYKMKTGDRRAFEDYIGGYKSVPSFLIIAPDFHDNTLKEVKKLDQKGGIDTEFCLIKSKDFQRLGEFLLANKDPDKEVPSSIFENTGVMDFEITKEVLSEENVI